MRKFNSRLALILALCLICSVMAVSAFAVEGTNTDPKPAAVMNLGESVYLMSNEAGEAANGFYWTMKVEQSGILFLRFSPTDDATFEARVEGSDGFEAEATNTKGNPVVKYVKSGETFTIFVKCSAKIITNGFVRGGTTDETIDLSNANEFTAPVDGKNSVVYKDASRYYAGKGLTISGEGIVNTTVTVEGKTYQDTDNDGKIELTVPAPDPNSSTPSPPAEITIENNNSQEISYKVVAGAPVEEGAGGNGGGQVTPPVHTHSLTKVPAETGAYGCIKIAEYYTCQCGKMFSDAAGQNEIDEPTVTTEHKMVKVNEKVDGCNVTAAHYICEHCEKYYSSDAAGKTEISKPTATVKHTIAPVAEAVDGCNVTEAHYACSVCKKLFKDAAGNTEIAKPATSVKHTIAPVAEVVDGCNVTAAHYSCSVCKKLFSDAAGQTEISKPATSVKHTIVPVAEVANGCNVTAAHYSCSVCKKLFSDAAGQTEISKPATSVKHALKEAVPAKEATTTAEGNIAYWICSCGKLWKDAALTQETNLTEVTIPKKEEEGCKHVLAPVAEAVNGCNVTAAHYVCSECDKLFSDAEGKNEISAPATSVKHALKEAVPAKEATTTAEGNIAYWICSCGKLWKDAALTQETNQTEVTIPKKDEVIEEECKHDLKHEAAIEAGCHSLGQIEHWFCTKCEKVWEDEELTKVTNNLSVILPALGSENVEHFEAEAATCHGQGTAEHWYCADCKTYYADEACTIVANELSLILPALGTENIKHVEAKEATATEDGNVEYWYCEDCKSYYLDAECTKLSNALSVVIPATGEPEQPEQPEQPEACKHDLVHMSAVEAGCHYEGHIEHWYCTKCEIVWQDAELTQVTNHKNVIVPALGGEVKHVEAKAPTATENGNIEHWICEECEQVWQNKELTQKTNIQNVILPATGEVEPPVEEECKHSILHMGAAAPGCHFLGNIEHWYCVKCDAVWADEALTQLTNHKNVILPATGSENVEHFEAVAAGCHSLGNTEYWYCADCQSYFDDEACTKMTNSKRVILPALGSENVEYIAAVAPGCHSQGNIEHWYCADCDTLYVDEACTIVTNNLSVILPALGSENVEHFEAEAATCHGQGVVEHWYCADCDTLYADEACTVILNNLSIYLPALGTDNMEHVEAKDPTATENGNIEHWYCPDCGSYYLDAEGTQLTNAMSVIVPATQGNIPGTGDMIIVFVVIAVLSSACVIVLKKRVF